MFRFWLYFRSYLGIVRSRFCMKVKTVFWFFVSLSFLEFIQIFYLQKSIISEYRSVQNKSYNSFLIDRCQPLSIHPWKFDPLIIALAKLSYRLPIYCWQKLWSKCITMTFLKTCDIALYQIILDLTRKKKTIDMV